MGNISIRKETFGTGYSGTISVPTGLSWLDSMALQSAATSAWQTSEETRRARQALDRISHDVDSVADAVERLENSIGLRLEEQTDVLKQQSEILEEIRGAVLNPSKTRASERVADALQLLHNDRYERALQVAQEAVDADPNNPIGFFAAGWSLIGLERFEDARPMFEEARDASTGDQRSLASRQAARSAFLTGKSELAYQLARDARNVSASDDERAAVAYDVAVYAWATGDTQTAVESIEGASRVDSRHAERALLDPAFARAAAVRDAAAIVLSELAEEIATRKPPVEDRISRLREQLPRAPQDQRSHTQLAPGVRISDDWALIRTSIKQRLAQADRLLSETAVGEPLQRSISALDWSDGTLNEIETQEIGRLRAAVNQHDAAAARENELNSRQLQVSHSRDQWARWVGLSSGVARRQKWVALAVIITLIGFAWSAVLPVGLIALAVFGLAFAAGTLATQKRDQADAELQSIHTELERRPI